MRPSLQYYDLVLIGIAVSLLGGGVVGVLTPVATSTAIVGFGVVALALLAHALFVNGPVDRPADLTEEVDPESLPVELPKFQN